VPTLGIFFILTLFFTELGKVAGTTPWELFLPVFVFAWAATLADDAYNLARPGRIVARGASQPGCCSTARCRWCPSW
jgi:hypothetical protein